MIGLSAASSMAGGLFAEGCYAALRGVRALWSSHPT